MKNIFCYEIEKKDDDYRVGILKEGYCNLFFDTGFAEGDEGVLKCYADVSGYSPIASYVEMPLRAAIDVIVAILKGILVSADRYMLPWDYLISTRTVYADRTGGDVKLIYVPVNSVDVKMRNKGSASNVMKEFCREMALQISVEEREAFDEVLNIFREYCLRPEECLRQLYALRGKTKTCLDL